jgi:hypothetical protein
LMSSQLSRLLFLAFLPGWRFCVVLSASVWPM